MRHNNLRDNIGQAISDQLSDHWDSTDQCVRLDIFDARNIDAIADAVLEAMPTWTPVTEALPGYGRVHFYSADLRNPTDVWTGIYRDGEWLPCGQKVVNVTHWKYVDIPA